MPRKVLPYPCYVQRDRQPEVGFGADFFRGANNPGSDIHGCNESAKAKDSFFRLVPIRLFLLDGESSLHVRQKNLRRVSRVCPVVLDPTLNDKLPLTGQSLIVLGRRELIQWDWSL